MAYCHSRLPVISNSGRSASFNKIIIPERSTGMFGNSGKDSSNQEQILFPNLAEMWKEMYFKTENAWAEAFKQFVSTDTFVRMLTGTLEQHLSLEKVMQQQVDQFFDHSPLPSKKDLARVAELVISLEDKIDVLDFEAADIIKNLTENLLVMVNAQQKTKQELEELKSEVAGVTQRLDTLLQGLAGPAAAAETAAAAPAGSQDPAPQEKHI